MKQTHAQFKTQLSQYIYDSTKEFIKPEKLDDWKTLLIEDEKRFGGPSQNIKKLATVILALHVYSKRKVLMALTANKTELSNLTYVLPIITTFLKDKTGVRFAKYCIKHAYVYDFFANANQFKYKTLKPYFNQKLNERNEIPVEKEIFDLNKFDDESENLQFDDDENELN